MRNINPVTKEQIIAMKKEIIAEDKNITKDKKIHRTMIEFSTSTYEADQYIEKELNCSSFEEKMFTLSNLFPDVSVVGKTDSIDTSEKDSIEMDYWAFLNTVIFN